jgi:hypothetical protein
VLFGPADALNGRDGRPESAAAEALLSNAAAGRGSGLATGRPDLAMVPTVLVCPSWQTVGARAYLDDVSSRAYRHVPQNVGRI